MTKIGVEPHLDLVGEPSADSSSDTQASAPVDRLGTDSGTAAGAAAGTAAGSGDALSELVILLCTFPSAEAIGELALTLIGEGLCACVNILHETLSIYRWQDEIATNKEVLCLIKTTRRRHDALVARLTELHPYEVPEIVTLATGAVNPPYLKWVNSVTSDSMLATVDRDPGDDEDR